MATINLSGSVREGRGKGPARQARLAGRVPGVLYGSGEASTCLELDRKDVDRALAGRGAGNTIVKLSVAGAEKMSVIREIQRDPLSRKIVHIDFQHISMTQRITVRVPVSFTGVPSGVKNMGGILEHLQREIEIRCLPGDIPERFTVDVSPLDIGDSIHVRDLTLPNVEILSDGSAVVATVVPPTVIEEAKPAEGEAPQEPELIGKEKAAEEPAEEKGKEKEKK
jgi:large subunit ribosomal protein L25